MISYIVYRISYVVKERKERKKQGRLAYGRKERGSQNLGVREYKIVSCITFSEKI